MPTSLFRTNTRMIKKKIRDHGIEEELAPAIVAEHSLLVSYHTTRVERVDFRRPAPWPESRTGCWGVIINPDALTDFDNICVGCPDS